MSPDDVRAGNDDLQFDRVSTGASPTPGADAPAVVCTGCKVRLENEYYHVNGTPVCETCRQAVETLGTTPRGVAPLLRAGLFGLGAAIAGAAIYYAVIAIANLEIGIIAILTGYMVGYAVRKGAAGRGGRRFQLLAVLLTYWSIGLAYTPLAFRGMTSGGDKATLSSTDTARTTPPASVGGTASAAAGTDSRSNSSRPSLIVALGVLFVFVFALPVVAVFGSLPSGLLSALIIFIGLRQAWTMTAAPNLQVSGPYRVGAGPSTAAT